MRKLLPLLFLLTNASIVLAQDQPPHEQNSNSQSSQQSVEQAINLTASHPVVTGSTQSPPADVLPGTVAGIGPSSPAGSMQPGDYGYSYRNDLRQLNF